jgi:hypothetical protein
LIQTEKKKNCFEDPLIENVFWRFFALFWSVKVCFDKLLFVSVVSIPVRNTETNRNNPKKMFFGFAKQTEKQPKQIEFQFVSVRTEKKFDCFEDTLGGGLNTPNPSTRSFTYTYRYMHGTMSRHIRLHHATSREHSTVQCHCIDNYTMH